MKAKTLLIAAAMLLAFSAAAFAQATYQVGSVPVSTVVATGNAEKAGDITFTQVSGSSIAGTITVTYPVAITVPVSVPSIINCSGGYAGANCPTINQTFSSFGPPGVIVINIPGTIASGNFTLTGVRVQASAFAVGAVNITATISTVNNAILAGQTSVTVITSVADGLATISAPTAAQIDAVGGGVTGSPVTLNVKEGFPSAFSVGTGIVLTVAAPPKGVTYTFPGSLTTTGTGITNASTFVTGNSAGVTSGTAVPIAYNSTTLSAYYYLVTPDANADQILETLPVAFTITGTATSTPLAIQSFNLTTVSLAPIAPAFSGTPASPAGLPVPRYVEKDQGPFTIMTVKGVTTALLMPFVSWTGAAGGNFDTGIAIANTTQDATMAVMGTTGVDVKPINGAITFYFFPQGSGTHPAAYTTSATSPGTGLDANGLVPSGSTYVVLLSQLLAATTGVTPAAPYQGYVIAVAGFTNAHGQYVLSNFTTFGQASLMLVLSNRAAPESLGN